MQKTAVISSQISKREQRYTVFYSDVEETTRRGFGRVARLPCIFDSRPGYHKLSSRYLIDRGLGLWHPKLVQTGLPRTSPTECSIRNYASWLANFLSWAEAREVDATTCDYVGGIYEGYQNELLTGRWSRDECSLQPTTVNSYVDVACDYLAWMAHKGERDPFLVSSCDVAAMSQLGDSGAGAAAPRDGKVRVNLRNLNMPSDDATGKWLVGVYKKHGEGVGLACELVLLGALRRAEIEAFRLDTIPINRDEWKTANPTSLPQDQNIKIEISYGCKGKSYGRDHGDKIGPSRTIYIPLHLAERIERYRAELRPRQVREWAKKQKGVGAQKSLIKSAVHLFRDGEGDRLTARGLYRAWTSVPLPIDGWSPHAGRDFWACSTLWREMMTNYQLDDLKGIPVSDISSLAMNIVRMKIQPQLGHKDVKTSLLYVRWIVDMLGTALPSLYIAELERQQ